jgi:mycothiol S-conjugate amidase
MPEPLCLLSVHAHPDDESSKGAATVARYHAAGVHTVLVTCTGGEEGDILNPAMDNPAVRAELPAIRLAELEAATAIIGYDEVILLGYRDSGMAGSEANANPACLAAAPLSEAVERLVRIVRQVRPQVMLTYPENQSGYPHPDHLRVHEISVAAFAAAGDASAFPEAGPVYQPAKLYYNLWSRRRILEMHEKFLELGMESPFGDRLLERSSDEDTATTVISIAGFEEVRTEALRAHATQVDPTSKHWFGLPPEVMRTIYPFDEYILGRDLTGRCIDPASSAGRPFEDDLFAGVEAARDLSAAR